MEINQTICTAVELENLGFSIRIVNEGVNDNSILVALNRNITTSEVREALSQVFDEIQFNIEYWYGKVKVS